MEEIVKKFELSQKEDFIGQDTVSKEILELSSKYIKAEKIYINYRKN